MFHVKHSVPSGSNTTSRTDQLNRSKRLAFRLIRKSVLDYTMGAQYQNQGLIYIKRIHLCLTWINLQQLLLSVRPARQNNPYVLGAYCAIATMPFCSGVN